MSEYALARQKDLRPAKKDGMRRPDANRHRALQEFLACAREVAETEAFVEKAQSVAATADTRVLTKTIARWKKTRAALTIPCSPAKQKLVNALTQGHTFTAEEALMLELETQQRVFTRDRELLRDTLSEAEAVERLQSPRQAIVARLHNKTLLAVQDEGKWKFPVWQFDANGIDGILVGLPDVLRALDVSNMGKIGWLTTPNRYLEGRTPLQAMQEGDVVRVVDQAWAVGCR